MEPIELEKSQCPKCIFCKIAQKCDPNSPLLFEDNEFVIFKDIKPASSHHYLVVPKTHVKDTKCLRSTDIDMIERMIAVGTNYLRSTDGNMTETRLGFHWPPFTSISHLHLHVISPVKDMGMIASFIFKPNTFWFVTAEWLLDYLRNKA